MFFVLPYYQEAKAKNFAQQFCVPTFMLRKLPPLQLKAYIISEKFNVTTQFAEKRLLHYKNQLLASKLQNHLSLYRNFQN